MKLLNEFIVEREEEGSVCGLYVDTNASEERAASIFRVEPFSQLDSQLSQLATCCWFIYGAGL
jgi:hypothetical protein